MLTHLPTAALQERAQLQAQGDTRRERLPASNGTVGRYECRVQQQRSPGMPPLWRARARAGASGTGLCNCRLG